MFRDTLLSRRSCSSDSEDLRTGPELWYMFGLTPMVQTMGGDSRLDWVIRVLIAFVTCQTGSLLDEYKS